MKHLPKHLRPRWRYLALSVESWPDASIDRRVFQRELWYSAQNLLGDPGSAECTLTVTRFSFDDGTGEAIVRVRRGTVERARAAIACIDEIDGWPIGVCVRGVSGTIRACEENYLGRRELAFDERNVVFSNEERVAVVRDGSVDVRLDDTFLGATNLDIT